MPLITTRRKQPRASAQGSGLLHDFHAWRIIRPRVQNEPSSMLDQKMQLGRSDWGFRLSREKLYGGATEGRGPQQKQRMAPPSNALRDASAG